MTYRICLIISIFPSLCLLLKCSCAFNFDKSYWIALFAYQLLTWNCNSQPKWIIKLNVFRISIFNYTHNNNKKSGQIVNKCISVCIELHWAIFTSDYRTKIAGRIFHSWTFSMNNIIATHHSHQLLGWQNGVEMNHFLSKSYLIFIIIT